MVTYTTNKNLALPTVAGDSGVWGSELNNGTTGPIDLMLGGVNSITLGSTNYILSSTEIQYLTQKLSGALLANVTVYSSCAGFCFVENNTSGAFTVTWQANFGGSDVGTGYTVPQGARMLFISDATAGARFVPVQPAFSYTDIQEISTPAAPSVGFMRLYAKTSDVLAAKTPSGTEYLVGKLPTVQRLTSGSGTYTPATGTIRICVRMVGGGGGGGAYGGTAGSAGGTTSFGTWTAVGGAGGLNSVGGTSAAGGYGGTDGTGTKICRVAGNYGGITYVGGFGGSSVLGGAGGVMLSAAGTAGAANSGSGGAGGQYSGNCGGGGGAGEYAEFWMTASQIGAGLSYSVGAAGAAGAGTHNGGTGGAGIILVEEYFN